MPNVTTTKDETYLVQQERAYLLVLRLSARHLLQLSLGPDKEREGKGTKRPTGKRAASREEGPKEGEGPEGEKEKGNRGKCTPNFST